MGREGGGEVRDREVDREDRARDKRHANESARKILLLKASSIFPASFHELTECSEVEWFKVSTCFNRYGKSGKFDDYTPQVVLTGDWSAMPWDTTQRERERDRETDIQRQKFLTSIMPRQQRSSY